MAIDRRILSWPARVFNCETAACSSVPNRACSHAGQEMPDWRAIRAPGRSNQGGPSVWWGGESCPV
jgi:hypothetical protein